VSEFTIAIKSSHHSKLFLFAYARRSIDLRMYAGYAPDAWWELAPSAALSDSDDDDVFE